jgi:peptidyl-prolyl cis-trans isomerase B (cyclophilin B)
LASKKKQQNLFTSPEARLKAYEQSQIFVEKENLHKKRDNRIAIISIIVTLVLVTAGQAAYFGFGPGKAAASASASASPSATAVPAASIAENRLWSGDLEIGGKKLAISLDGTKAPQAVANFVTLAKSGFYKDLSCHRLTTEGIFVLQCGDPSGDGSGGPGYSWGPIENAPKDNVYKRGVLAMARQGNNAQSMGSQFFIVYKDSVIPSDTAGGYTVFGSVLSGLDAVDSIAKQGVIGGGYDGIPTAKPKLTAVSVK